MKYLLTVLISLCLLFGYLSYHFYGSKEKAEGDLRVAQASLIALQSSLDKKEQECKIADELASEWQKEKQEADKQKESDITKIDNIPAKKPKVEAKPNEKNDVVDIDAKLPDDLRLLLQQSYDRDKGSISDDS